MKTVIENTEEFWRKWYENSSIIIREYIKDKMELSVFCTQSTVSVYFNMQGFTLMEVVELYVITEGLCSKLNRISMQKFRVKNRIIGYSTLELSIVEE